MEKKMHKIDHWSLENDIDYKITADGWEIFTEAVNKYGITPESIHHVDRGNVSADWCGMGSIEITRLK